MMNDSLKQLLEITEQHLLAEFSHENTQEYKRRLQELVGKTLDEHPEYKESDEFKKLLKSTDEYLQKEISLKDDLQYCRKLSTFLCDILGLWRIESISSVKETALPTKEEMEKLLPSSWPARWDEIEKESADGIITVKLGHISPYPEYVENPSIKLVTVADYSTDGKKGIEISKYDFVANLSITGYGDKQDARQFFENYFNDFISFDNKAPGAAFDINIGDLLEAFAPKELIKEAKEAVSRAHKSLSKTGIKAKKGKFLGKEALFITGKNDEQVCQAVLINNFFIMGDILGYPLLPMGNTPVHSVACQTAQETHNKPGPSILVTKGDRVVKHINPKCQCNYCKPHPACSTLQTEDFIHREKVEALLQDIFARIKGKTNKPAKEVGAEIIRGQNKVRNPKETSGIENGDIIKTNSKTQINLADRGGNKITIGGNTELKMETVYNLKLMAGTITTFLKKIRPKSKFEIRTPTAIAGVRGTIFSVWTDKSTTTLTVIEGEVEFSDLNGNKVIVMSNQSCVCSKEQGLQKPVTLPINLKEQYKEV
ncbi:MAG: FecR family protein [bacterium]